MILLHLILGLIFGTIFFKYFWFIFIGSIIADIDHLYPFIKSRLLNIRNFADSIINEEKYGVSYKSPFVHSLTGAIIISIVVLVFFDKIGALCFFLAYLLHLVLDWPDIDRKYYFYPFKIKFKGFLQVWSYEERVITLIFFGMISALAAITLSINGQHLLAIVFLAASIFFDYFDKNAALYLRIKNRFGKELDSLVGLIAFVVAPAIFVITQFSTNPLLLVIAAVFMSCGIYRLIKFHWDGRVKTGGLLEMPIALNGIIFPIIYLVCPSIYIYEIMLIASSIFMVIKIKTNRS